MASELLQVSLAMLAIVLPLVLGWVLVTLSVQRQRGASRGAARP